MDVAIRCRAVPAAHTGKSPAPDLFSYFNIILFSVGGILAVLFLHPPLPFFTGWRPLSHDRRPAIMTVGAGHRLDGVLSLRPVTDDYFGIVATPTQMYVTLTGMLLVWVLASV